MNDFGRIQLEKYGWRSGKGLGKNENGIKTAIKPSLKFNKSGVGYDSGAEFSFQWWEHIFNKTAKDIVVVNSEDKVEIKTKNEISEISAEKSQKSTEGDKLLYGSFIKKNINYNEKEKNKRSKSSEDDDDNNDCSSKFSYEDIFKKCKGRTAHKAARHGIKMNGKLKRIEQQERKLSSEFLTPTSNKKSKKCNKISKRLKSK
uniref:G patch domain-containing protein 4 n=1 Tax=Hottentotta judaicus TaxID=6863 RepID=F1CIX3_HOTJU|nr:putative RNA-Binding protein [Hottentotta judaicus]